MKPIVTLMRASSAIEPAPADCAIRAISNVLKLLTNIPKTEESPSIVSPTDNNLRIGSVSESLLYMTVAIRVAGNNPRAEVC
ncbi:hypothetical protein MHB84_27405 [Paenibacillus sp. FSL F4-0087]|uniref:hypothetical protein n=1 Tax=Paenibacillus sp. FSL F4-0087 TaxID=2921368 RepID=UPI00117CC4C9